MGNPPATINGGLNRGNACWPRGEIKSRVSDGKDHLVTVYNKDGKVVGTYMGPDFADFEALALRRTGK